MFLFALSGEYLRGFPRARARSKTDSGVSPETEGFDDFGDDDFTEPAHAAEMRPWYAHPDHPYVDPTWERVLEDPVAFVLEKRAREREALDAWGKIQALAPIAVALLPDTAEAAAVGAVMEWASGHDGPEALERDPLTLRVLELIQRNDYAGAVALIRASRAPS